MHALLKRARIFLARSTASCLTILAKAPGGVRSIRVARQTPVLGPLLRGMLAFRGTFNSLEESRVYVRRFLIDGHEYSSDDIDRIERAHTLRESDYPVLFYLLPLALQLRTVFDLGGGLGHLFYAYDRMLRFSNELKWMVSDLPSKSAAALSYAESRGEKRLAFTCRWMDAAAVDLLLISGALHYFERKLPDMLRDLDGLPKMVIINRTPFSGAGDNITAQDGGEFALPCILHDRDALIAGMADLGYELVARWPVHERKMHVPLYPELSDIYLGLFFKLQPSTFLNKSRDYRQPRQSTKPA